MPQLDFITFNSIAICIFCVYVGYYLLLNTTNLISFFFLVKIKIHKINVVKRLFFITNTYLKILKLNFLIK